MILCALDQSFCTSLEVPLPQALACFLPIHSRHVPDILPLHLLFFPFVFHFSLFTLLILLWILFLIHFHCSFFTYFPEQNLGIPYIPTQIMMMMMMVMMMLMLLLLLMMIIIPHDIFFIFLIIAKNVFHVSHSLSNNGVYPRLDIGQVWDDMQSWKPNANIFSFPFSLLTLTARPHCSTVFCPFPLQM